MYEIVWREKHWRIAFDRQSGRYALFYRDGWVDEYLELDEAMDAADQEILAQGV